MSPSPRAASVPTGSGRRRLLLFAVLPALLTIACPAEPALLSVRAEPAAGGTRLTLYGAPGVRINARLKPGLELSDGRVLRFDSPALTQDSSYFASPPEVLVPGTEPGVHGRLRASVCPRGERVCRQVTLNIE